MLKNKGPGYTSRMKAKVSYPKLKKTEADPKDPEVESPTPIVIRKETVILSKSGDKSIEEEPTSPSKIDTAGEEPVKKNTSLSRKDTIVIQRHNDKSTDELNSASKKEIDGEFPVKSLPPRPVPGPSEAGKPPRDHSKSLSKPEFSRKNVETKNNQSTLKNQKALPVSSDKTIFSDQKQKAEHPRLPEEIHKSKNSSSSTLSSSSVPSKEDVIYLVETEAIFDDKEHRKAILDLVTNYAKNVHKEQILGILDHAIFDEVSHLEEVVTMLGDFVAAKLNNNC